MAANGISTLETTTLTVANITQQATLDLASLASTLAGLPNGQAHGAVFGNGETLTPGVYDVSEAAAIQGILNLDAQGDSTALFVFRVGGALSSVAGSQVLLANSANAANIFWRSTGAVGLGANSAFVGTAIAVSAANSLAAASTMTGRLLSTEGAVAVDSSTIIIPTGIVSPTIPLGVISVYTLFTSVGAVGNTGTSSIEGDVGTNVGAISGFDYPTTVDGNIYAAGSFGTIPNPNPTRKEIRQKAKLDLAALKRQGNVLNGDGTVYSAPLGSAQFSGSNYLSVAGGAGTAMGTGDFTWECWVYPTSSSDYQCFIDTRTSPLAGGDNTGFFFGTNFNTLAPIYYTTSLQLESTESITLNAWNHVALTRDSGTVTLWVNGASGGTQSNTTNLTEQRVFIGGDGLSTALNLTGNISNLRIVKGQALYTANFTPPTSTLTAVDGTQLLLLLTEFVDGSDNQFTITNGGSVTLSTAAPTLTISAPFYRARATYDLTLLPTQFNDDDIINNPNAGGLVAGRPWIETVSTFTFYEAFGTTSALETTQYVSGNKIYAYASTYDVPSFNPARVVVNDIEVLLQGDDPLPYGRGHNLVVLDTYGDVVVPAVQLDTYIDPANLTTLASALGAVPSGNIVVLVVYDASALNSTVRTAINTGYGSTNANTWTAERRSHIFIGVKI